MSLQLAIKIPNPEYKEGGKWISPDFEKDFVLSDFNIENEGKYTLFVNTERHTKDIMSLDEIKFAQAHFIRTYQNMIKRLSDKYKTEIVFVIR